VTRCYSSSSEPDLKETLKEVIPAKRELLKKVKAMGSKVIGEVKIENTIGGMRYAIDFHPTLALYTAHI
jgi:citrate synthase